MDSGDNRLECKICKQKKNPEDLFVGTECFDCWERGINEAKVQELRKKLIQYLDVDKFKIKEGLSLNQLEKVRKIIEDNYVEGSDTRGGVASERGGKELIKAMWTTGQKSGFQPSDCLKKIEQEIRRLERASEPYQPVKIRINCPFCNKEFSCEVEKTDPTEKREAKEELNEKMTTHIREVHGEEERERERENTDPNDEEVENKPSVNQKSEQNNQSSASSNKNKLPLPLIIIGILLVSILLVGCFFLFKKHKSKK